MYQLIIAEKPSVAQSIAAVLGAKRRDNGYLEGNGYLVSWCFGHLAELASAETYNADYAKWRCEDLPIVPQSWRFMGFFILLWYSYTLVSLKDFHFLHLRNIPHPQELSAKSLSVRCFLPCGFLQAPR